MQYDANPARTIINSGQRIGDAMILSRRARVVAALAASLLLFAATAKAQPSITGDERFRVEDLIIEARDGTPLSAIVVTDATAEGPQPTALLFTLYIGPNDIEIAKYAARKGYASVIAYPRGVRTGAVEIVPYEHDGEDAYDVVEWIAAQRWSDGQVGMYGGSYAGFAQWAAARLKPPHLKTIVPQVAAAPGIAEPVENGVFIVQLAYNWPLVNAEYAEPPGDAAQTWFLSGRPFRTLDAARGSRHFQRWLTHPTFDDYWRRITINGEEFRDVDIPVLTTTGYYDDAQLAALYYFREHHRRNPDAEHYLVIGPYDHRGGQINAAPVLRGYEIDPVARRSMGDLAFEWFDHVLKGRERPALVQDTVNFEVMGADEWRHVPSLDAMSEARLKLYFGTDEAPGGHKTLTQAPPAAGLAHTQRVDFADRETQHNDYTPVIVRDALPQSRGLSFASAPFDTDVELNGAIAGELHVTIDKRDFDYVVAVYEQLPDGTYFFLNRYLGRASLAADRTQRRLLTPGVETVIRLWDTRVTSRRIGAGSRIVAVLNVNKNPFEQVNHGTGRDVSDESIADAGEPLEVTWHAESYIELPLQPARRTTRR